jgi:hypothetical protein
VLGGAFRRENREVPRSPACGDGRAGKAEAVGPRCTSCGKSDDPVVAAKLPNNVQGGAAEAVQGRGSPTGNASGEPRPGRRVR